MNRVQLMVGPIRRLIRTQCIF